MRLQRVLAIIHPVLPITVGNLEGIDEIRIEVPDDLVDLQFIHGALVFGVFQYTGIEILKIAPLFLRHVLLLRICRVETVFPLIAFAHLFSPFSSTKRSCSVSTAAS